MPKFASAARKSNLPGVGFSAATLAMMPVCAVAYMLVLLPFIPRDGNERPANMLAWPVAAALTLVLLFSNWAKIDYRFFRSLPIISLLAYFVFAAASVTWAYSPDFAFTRLLVEMLAFIVVVVPFALPEHSKHTIPGLLLCYAIALAINAGFVLTTPASAIGHPGYFDHKQELGQFAAISIILFSYALLYRDWRSLVAVIAIGVGFWLVFASESKAALALALLAIAGSWLILLICKKTRLTPAYIVAAVVVASMFVHDPIERLGYRLYGDSTLTGRTGIWAFANYQISQKPWLGWGFHSYYFVPNSPQNKAPGYIRDMPSSHNGYLELKLETGRIGYWIFLLFIYSSLHLLEQVRRKDPARAWCFLSIELFALLDNLLDSGWLTLTDFWLLYLIVVAESVRYSLPRRGRPLQLRSERRFRQSLLGQADAAHVSHAVPPAPASSANVSGPPSSC